MDSMIWQCHSENEEHSSIWSDVCKDARIRGVSTCSDIKVGSGCRKVSCCKHKTSQMFLLESQSKTWTRSLAEFAGALEKFSRNYREFLKKSESYWILTEEFLARRRLDMKTAGVRKGGIPKKRLSDNTRGDFRTKEVMIDDEHDWKKCKELV